MAALLGAFALIAAACGGDSGGDEDETFTIGVSNTLAGNGWREQMICAIKAEALASGVVDEVVLQNENTDTTGQIGQIEALISQGVDAIIINPTDREGLNSVIEEAIEPGHRCRGGGPGRDCRGCLCGNQRSGGLWRARCRAGCSTQLGGEGNVVEMRGIDGVPADTDRHNGFLAALEDYPGITVTQETFTGWDPTTGAQQALDIISAGDVDGIWTSGIDYTVVEQFQNANAPFVPIVGADNNGFIDQLINESTAWSAPR